jgi:hypothetical protein
MVKRQFRKTLTDVLTASYNRDFISGKYLGTTSEKAPLFQERTLKV